MELVKVAHAVYKAQRGNTGSCTQLPQYLITVMALSVVLLPACNFSSQAEPSNTRKGVATNLTYEERHRLYTAALTAADLPHDSPLFKQACERIGIMDSSGSPNGNYMDFVREHVEWGLKPETEQFRREIDTKAKAEEYANNCLRSR